MGLKFLINIFTNKLEKKHIEMHIIESAGQISAINY